MKKILLLLFLGMFISGGCRVKKSAIEVFPSTDKTGGYSQSSKFSEQSTWLLGYFNPAQMSMVPHSEWYLKGYDEYMPDQEVIRKLKLMNMEDLSITVVLGTWCPDSRREVPRFMRILDQLGFPASKVTFIGVDNEKLSPVGDFDKLGIERVPTFIFLRNKVESGRIIENPVASLEQDMSDILERKGK